MIAGEAPFVDSVGVQSLSYLQRACVTQYFTASLSLSSGGLRNEERRSRETGRKKSPSRIAARFLLEYSTVWVLTILLLALRHDDAENRPLAILRFRISNFVFLPLFRPDSSILHRKGEFES